ncbi:MAG: hypothetical protein COS68_00750 [Elusimicrobia bacterium CG06_land_8_20_14_3_00_38_11]|nr:MAG: hypothetical protein COS68_00750 [Elusimicrobia bacterium CG06_land_8_20_14_3_00_38_11]
MANKTVLIVEDEPSVVDLLKFLLEKDGYTTAVAFDGEEALKQVTAARPDLILLDIMLPKIDGYTVQKQLQADEKTANIPTIVLTAKGGMQDMFQFEKNIVAFIEKPFDPKILREKVKEVLNV